MELIIDNRYRVYPLDPLNWTIDKKSVVERDGEKVEVWRRVGKYYSRAQYAVAYVYDQLLREHKRACSSVEEMIRALEEVERSVFAKADDVMEAETPTPVPDPVPLQDPKTYRKPRTRRKKAATAEGSTKGSDA